MHSTRKLTRAEACAALAYKLGWTRNGNAGTVACDMWKDPEGRLHNEPPDYFTDLYAARELVAWLYENTDEGAARLWDNFFWEFRRLYFDNPVSMPELWEQFAAAFLATPEQITVAACVALGLTLAE